MNRGYPRAFGGPPRNRRASVHGAILLYQLLERMSTLDTKPPVTVLLILLNLLNFALGNLRTFLPRELLPAAGLVSRWMSPKRVCLNPRAVLHGEHARLLLSSFVHGSDIHVLYNMLSFLYKGVTVESSLGSQFFLFLIVYLSIFAHVVYVAIAVLADRLGITSHLMDNCVIGFSGVVFGLKVIVNSDRRFSERANRIFGFSIPGGGAPWAELFLASAVMPNVSFLGHLSGILAGLVYVHVPRYVSRWIGGQRRGRYARLHED